MRDTNLLQLASGLTPTWTVTASEFDPEARRLDIHIDFPVGGRCACSECGAANCPAHDTEQMTWRLLNFFQHQGWRHARVPRARCSRCGVKTLGDPWACASSGFTLPFEALVMAMFPVVPVNAVARQAASLTPGCGVSCIILLSRPARIATPRG